MRRRFCHQAARQLYARDFKFSKVKDASTEQSLTPKKIFDMLEKKVVGQTAAKRMLAIAYSRISITQETDGEGDS